MSVFNGSGVVTDREMPIRSMQHRELMPMRRKAIDLPYIKNQAPTPGEEVQCCVSAAITACMEHLGRASPPIELSMLYHYFQVSPYNPHRPMTLKEGFDTAEFDGVCRLSFHPYIVDFMGVSKRPSGQAHNDAQEQAVERYSQPRSIWELKTWKDSLNKDIPLILAFYLNKELYFRIPNNNFTHPTLTTPRPANSHVVIVTGYDDFERRFTIQDCRGSGFGDIGKWYLPYSIAMSQDFSSALGIITKIT